MNSDLVQYRKKQKQKYDNFKNNQERERMINFLKNMNFSHNISEKIIDTNLIIIIQQFFRKYRLNDKICINLQDIIDYNSNDVIKFSHGYNIYGYHYLYLKNYFAEFGFKNPYNGILLQLYSQKRINDLIRKKNKYIFTSQSDYYHFESISYNKFWDAAQIFDFFENRGINNLKVPENIFNDMLDLPPSIYAVEIISENNINKSFATFDDFPSEEEIKLPLGIYNQLKIVPNENTNFKMKIIEPPKGLKITIRCMITNDKLLQDIKGKLTSEFNKHKILSKNQVIIVESDINYGMIPFRIEELEPSNVINIINVDLQIDFLESLPYNDPVEALLIELNK